MMDSMAALFRSRILLWGIGALVVYFLVFFNLTRFPAPWFDEGSHLHVPKTLVQYGVYADRSSEGFRYYGPTIGVGPTVMLPIAGMFKLFGIGLWQARFVMGVYLIAAVYVFYRLVEHLAGRRVAWVACALLVSSRSVLLLNYGRQVLGEVPGLFFLVLGGLLWLSDWGRDNWKRLTVIGLCFGLAMITKYQYLLFLAPMLLISWLLDRLYYRTSSHGHFLIPGVVAAFSFALWQGITLQYLGPATVAENFALLRASAEGAAFNFDPARLASNFEELTSRSAYLGALLPALLYGFFLSLPRHRQGQKWSVLFLLASLNLVWYVVASIGWIRYAFLGFALSSIFVAQLFNDLTEGFVLERSEMNVRGFFRSWVNGRNAYRFALLGWLGFMIAFPMAKNVAEIVLPEPDYAQQMANYLNENVPTSALIETWEPEMGFLTDHRYHYPPPALLAVAVEQVYAGGEPVQSYYEFVETENPEYVLAGEFSKWTEIYNLDELQNRYELVQSIGDYDLYKLRK